jgi:hypothetical protein
MSDLSIPAKSTQMLTAFSQRKALIAGRQV